MIQTARQVGKESFSPSGERILKCYSLIGISKPVQILDANIFLKVNGPNFKFVRLTVENRCAKQSVQVIHE